MQSRIGQKGPQTLESMTHSDEESWRKYWILPCVCIKAREADFDSTLF